ncbi:Asp/Glu/hydantoin racemase [Sulfitobacter alexandrii]|uniref:Hydantoin racemase n=1 Tax=Sulfitobacter alexandrii TaxID=1917485 RepID=A0A1J0WLF4_9RHOB|nr:aspartate/glutamate racemase family protein [Sulfitobacter alexandrii]APE45201.1 Asp/Glu/hydantoin racemase [Sulfitobacter alexandrii]
MRIHIVNPNSSTGMTEQIAKVARRYASAGTTLDVTCGTGAPASIEGYTDEAISVPIMLDQIRAAETRGADAHVIACFDDPGLAAAREIAQGPVIGLCEASTRVAMMLSSRFSIVTTLARSVPIIEDLADAYGAGRRCRRVRAIDMPVLAVEEEPERCAELLAAEIRRARKEDNAEAVVLGCAGMADLCIRLTKETGVLVIDGVTAAVRLSEALVGMRYATSKLGAYAAPRSKAGGFPREVA